MLAYFLPLWEAYGVEYPEEEGVLPRLGRTLRPEGGAGVDSPTAHAREHCLHSDDATCNVQMVENI